MNQDFKKPDAKHCYACLQWDGPRSYDPVRKLLKVDETKEDNCRLLHKKVKGSSVCERFFPFI
jgi:hypothetical protein